MSASIVYIIRRGDGGPVKIGVTVNLQQRLASLQNAHDTPLIVLRQIAGGRATERWLHERFSDRRLIGEWFTFSEEMMTIQPPPEPETEQPFLDAEDVLDAPITDEMVQAWVKAGLARSVGQYADAAERLGRLVGCDPRAARRWLEGSGTPSATMLLRLMVCFPEVAGEIMPHVIAPHMRRVDRAMAALEVAKAELQGQLRRYLDPVAAMASDDLERGRGA